jgi:hypothetical protein
MARFTRKGGRKTRKMRKSHTRKRIKIQFGGSAEKEKVDGLLTTIVQKLKSKKYDNLVYEKEIYELFDSIVILLSQTDQVSQDMYKQIAFINANNISGDENVNKLIIFMSQLLSRRLEPPGYVKKQIPKDLLNNIDSIFAKYKNLCDCVEQIKPCDLEELAKSMDEIYEPRTTIKKNIEKLETHVKDNYDDMQIYITLSGFVKFHRTLDKWREMINKDTKVTRIVELLKPIVDKYSFLVPRTFLTNHLKELSETEFDELFVKKPESKKPESKKPESKKPESKEPESKEPESKKPESKKPESKKPESKKPESKKPESKKPESKKPESKKPESKEEPKPKEGGRKVEDTSQINYVKGIPSEKRQKKLEEREMKLMEEAENAEKSRLKIEQAAKEQAAKEVEAKQQASKQVAVTNYIFAEIDPINNKIKRYSDEINKMLASANYTDTTFDTLMKIDIEQLYSTIQSNFGAFAEFFDREDGKFKYMFNYELDLEQLEIEPKYKEGIKQEYKKAQCMLLFTIGYLNDILKKSGVEYAKYILKGGGAMKLRLGEILAGKQTDLLFFSNDIDVKSYLNPIHFAKVVDPNFLRIYQFGLSLIISKIFRELTIRDLMMLKFFPERSILKIQINFLEPDTQPLASKIMSRGSATAVFKISLAFAGNIPIADIDPSPPSEIGIPTTQDLIVDNFKSQELVFYVDQLSEFVDDKIKYYQVYYDTYLQNPQDDYISKTFRKFLKYINLFIKLMQIEETLFNEEQKKDLEKIEKQKDLEKIEEKLQKQMEEKLKKQMEEKLKRKSSNPYLVKPPQPPQPNQGGK